MAVLFDTLRRKLATERNVPPYVIFGDRTLRQMAYYVPQTSENLAQISGVGAVKLEQLGEEFLAEIVAYAREHRVEDRLDSPRRPEAPSSLDKVRQRHPRAYEKWSAEEDERLKEQYGQGRNVSELAELFGRQPSGIRSRLIRLGLEPNVP